MLEHGHHHRHDIGTHGCDDQLPLMAVVGRGIAGDTYRVKISEPDSCTETHLEGEYYDQANKEWHSDWISENINGGELSYQYRLRPYTVPQTFTMTFIYRRPGRCEWSWTTPAIPYIWDMDGDGKPDADEVVGSGVATIFLRAGKDKAWKEYLVYPDGTTREDFNAPEQGEAWTSNITFGVGGDIEIPNIDDICKVLGITVEQFETIVGGGTITINGVTASDIIDYIDKQDDNHSNALSDHIHKDMGFNNKDHASTGAFGGHDTVKEYIDAQDQAIKDDLDEAVTNINNTINGKTDDIWAAIESIVQKVYGGGTVDKDTGQITWPNTDKIAVGNMNLYGNDGTSRHIRTAADSNWDIYAR